MAHDSSPLTKQELAELLRSELDSENAQIDDISIKRLTKAGDNYGSTMLAVDVHLKPGPRTLHLVAKMLPRSPVLQQLFKCDITVKKETDLYLLVRPAYEKIQKENNVPEDQYLDVFPVCYGARISSKGDNATVDEGAMILQENLRAKDYECGDRINGLHLGHCKLVVDKLARFHATAVAIKIKKPEEFEDTVLRAATRVVVGPYDLKWVKSLETIPEYEAMKERITSALLISRETFANINPEPPREPFATIIHNDLWVNNIMFHYGSDPNKENPKDLKFVDFQVTLYNSPVKDLLFFLYSSASLEVLSDHYDFLIRFYYDSFLDFLHTLGCDTTAFTFELFLKEIETAAVLEFWHIAFMLASLSVSSEDTFSTDDMKFEHLDKLLKVGKIFSKRASKFILDFASRKWI